MFPAVERESTVVALSVDVALAPVCVMFPAVERESTVVALRVDVPADCVMLPELETLVAVTLCRLEDPETANDVCVPIFVTLFCVAVANVPVRVAPDTSPVAARDNVDIDPVLVIDVEFKVFVVEEEAFKVPVVTPTASNRLVTSTLPTNCVVPTLVSPTFCRILLTGFPFIDRVVQLILVAATSTASMFFICATTVDGINIVPFDGTSHGVLLQLFISALVNITLWFYFIPDLVP